MKELLNEIDRLINKITMYKLVLWGLRVLFGIAWAFSIVGVLPFGAISPLVSITILVGVCYIANYLFANLYGVNANSESTGITALLLFFIFQPPRNVVEGIALALAGIIAIASKYVVALKERHLVNPVAFGALVVGLAGLLHSRWWIGQGSMLVFVLILSVLIVRKIHRFPMFLSFVAVAGTLAVVRGLGSGASLPSLIKVTAFSFPIVFFGGLMLTEPVTTPPRRYQQVLYGLLVGLLFSSGLHTDEHTMTPELALIIGNLAVYVVASRRRQPLSLKSVSEIGSTIFEYRFKPTEPVKYQPGQYLELTLPLTETDFRGNRRAFTIASSPTEDEIIFGVKQVPPISAFKTALTSLDPGTEVTANNLAGDFLLPSDARTKLVFIAGGIGVTPFRSMLKYLVDTGQNRSITLFYAISDPQQIVYKDVLTEAREHGLKVVYVLTPLLGQTVPANWSGEVGYITKELIAKHVLDYPQRTFYISGPDVMVQANKKLLRSMDIPRNQIKTDYFAGY